MKYCRALAKAMPNREIETIGKSDENRELVVIRISSEDNIRNLQTNCDKLAKIADPRGQSPDQIKNLIATTKPHYYLMGGLHSGETGPSEMLMEFARVLSSVTLFRRAASVADVESLVVRPAAMLSASIREDEFRAVGVSRGMIHMSVGLEDEADLIADLDEALTPCRRMLCSAEMSGLPSNALASTASVALWRTEMGLAAHRTVQHLHP